MCMRSIVNWCVNGCALCSVIPYLSVKDSKLLPLPVVTNAAGLLYHVSSRALQLQYPSDVQCRYLNDLCSTAGLDFTFDVSTALVDVDVMCSLSYPTPYTRQLPGHDPFSHALFINNDPVVSTSLPPNTQSISFATPPLDASISAALAVSNPANVLSSVPLSRVSYTQNAK